MDATKFVLKSKTFLSAAFAALVLIMHLMGKSPAWLVQDNLDLILSAITAVGAAYFRISASVPLSMSPNA